VFLQPLALQLPTLEEQRFTAAYGLSIFNLELNLEHKPYPDIRLQAEGRITSGVLTALRRTNLQRDSPFSA